MKRVALIALAAVAVLAILGVGVSQALQDNENGAATADANEQSFAVAEAGAVTVTVQSGRISVISIQRVEGWTPKVVRQSGPRVRVEFVNGAAAGSSSPSSPRGNWSPGYSAAMARRHHRRSVPRR